jgi:CHAT domain-containing protein
MLQKKAILSTITVLVTITGNLTVNLLVPLAPAQLLAQTANPRKAQADKLQKQGIEQFKTSQFTAALQSWEQALKIYREIKDRQGEGVVLGNLGIAYDALGDYRKAINYQQQSLAIDRERKDRLGESRSLGNLGLAYYSLGDYPQAIGYQQQRLKIALAIEDRLGEGQSLGNLGLAYNALSDYPKAIEYYQQCLALLRSSKDYLGESVVLHNLGDTYTNLGDYPKAIAYQQQSLAIQRELKDLDGEAKSLGSLGIVYRQLGEYYKAIAHQQQSLAIQRELKDFQGESATLGNIGNIYINLEDYPKAIDYQQQSLALARQIQFRSGEGNAFLNLGIAYNDLGDYPKAIEYQQQALAIAREIKERSAESASLGNLAFAYNNSGQYLKAIEYQQQGLAIAREIKDRLGVSYALNNLGAAYYKQGNFQLAEHTLNEAIDIYEFLRNRQLKDSEKVSLFDTQKHTYSTLQKVLISQAKIDTALEISERGRARAFVDLLADKQKIQFQPKPKIEQLKQIAKEQKSTLVEYSIISDEFQIQGKEQIRESKLFIWVIKPTGEVKFRQANLKSLWQQQNSSLSNLVARTLASLGVAQIATRSSNNQPRFAPGDLVRRINEDFPNDPAWKVVAVDPQNQTVTIRLTTWRDTERPIERKFDRVTKVFYAGTANNNLQQLHKILIEPISDLLPTNPTERVTFIPQGSLFFVPFPALQDANRKYLIERHTILTAPAIQVLELTRQQSQNRSATVEDKLIVGNPTMPNVSSIPGERAEQLQSLPYAEIEAKQVAQLFNTQAITGDRATKSLILQQLPKAKIVHFATHGLLDDFTGGSIPGAIALAPEPLKTGELGVTNGLLTASEIFDLKLNAELVVLSACNTGRGKITGDGVIGLSRSLISAGVPSVVVSLWSIPDAPSASLMTEFYQRLQQGDDKASALRQAMLKTLSTHPEPKNWAAFTLIGETRSISVKKD